MKRRSLFSAAPLACFLLLAFSFTGPLCADTSSASYKIESEIQSGGGVFQITSASYKIEEGAVSFFTKELLTSANYKVEGAIGFGSSQVPVINSVTPGNFSKHFTDDSPSFTVTAQDPDSDPLQYQLKLDGTIKAPFQTSNVLSHALISSDKGRRTYAFEVKDTDDGTTVQNQAAYVFRRPVK